MTRHVPHGGRWRVTKGAGTKKLPWYAWTSGAARRWNRPFATHADAMTWVNLVTKVYSHHTKAEADVILTAATKSQKK